MKIFIRWLIATASIVTVLLVNFRTAPPVKPLDDLPQLDYPNVTTSQYGEGWDPCANFADFCICIQPGYTVLGDQCEVSQYGGKPYPKAVYICPDDENKFVLSHCLEVADHGADLLDHPIQRRHK